LVRFFASRQRNEQPASHAVREELAMFLSFDNTNTMVYLSLKYRYYRLFGVVHDKIPAVPVAGRFLIKASCRQPIEE
jgi:hypothetical protein